MTSERESSARIARIKLVVQHLYILMEVCTPRAMNFKTIEVGCEPNFNQELYDMLVNTAISLDCTIRIWRDSTSKKINVTVNVISGLSYILE